MFVWRLATMADLSQMPLEGIAMATAIAHGYEGLGGQKGNKFYPYQGKADRKNVWTIGRGHVITPADTKYGILISDVRYNPWLGLTLAQVDALYKQDINARITTAWTSMGRKGTSQEAAAFLDLTFNSPSALKASSTPMKAHKAGDKKACAEGILLYHAVKHDDGTVTHPRGLWRRAMTRALCYYKGRIHIAKTDATEAALEKLIKDAGLKYKKPKFS